MSRSVSESQRIDEASEAAVKRNVAVQYMGFLRFIDAFRLRLHGLLSIFLVLLFPIQALFITPSYLLPWGSLFTSIFSYSQEHRGLGFDYVPYEALTAICATILCMQLVLFCAFGLAYYLFQKASERFEIVRRIITVVLFVFSLFPFVPLTIANQLLICDSSTSNLLRFPLVECYTVPNVIWMVVAIAVLLTQVGIFAVFTYITCNLTVNTNRFNWTSSEECFFMVYEQVSFVISVAIYNLATTALPWWTGTVLLVQSLISIVVIFCTVPFHVRWVNSIYSGFISARLFVC
jgi:hypothetical protein